MKTHGMSKHPAYSSWLCMRRRCSNPSNNRWERYGGRGIKVCTDWQESFEAFWEDMGGSWEKNLQLDRINNDGDYEKTNCRWVSPTTQANNRSNTFLLNTPWGVLTVPQAAKKTGLPRSTLWQRIRYGTPEEDWLKPVPRTKNKVKNLEVTANSQESWQV